MKHTNRISPVQELLLLIRESYAILMGQTRNLLICLLFPLGSAIITVWIAGEDMFVNMESTKSALFIVVCAAIWGGMFNSIQAIVKERKNIKRDFISGALRIECYTLSRALVQMGLCAIQSAILCLSFLGVSWAYGNELPGEGLVFGSVMAEFYISVFLVMYAADAMGMMISCMIKNEQLASQISPYILMAQLLFSGVLFTMEGAAANTSGLMLSRWGMEALGSSSDLNGMPLTLQKDFPMIVHEAEEMFEYTSGHLWQVWLVLALFVLVPLVIGNFALYGVKKDGRG